MSLEEQVRQFAESVRLALLAKIAQQASDTSTAKIIGIDDKGNIKIENKGIERISKGLGSSYQSRATKVIFDKTGAIEYRHARKKDLPILVSRPEKPIPTFLTPVGALFHPFVIDAEVLFDIPTTAFYMVTYGTVLPAFAQLYHLTTARAGGSSNGIPYPETVTTTLIVNDYSAMASASTTYRITVGAVVFRSEESSGAAEDGSASASVSGLDLDLSVSGSGYDGDTAIAINVQQSTEGGNVTLSAEGAFQYTDPPNVIRLNRGEAAADFNYAYVSFQRAVYYFQMPNDIATDQVKIRQIDLNAITPNKVYESRIVHNYVSREAGDVFVYTIYYVLDVDMSQEYEISNTNTQYSKYISRLIGKVTKYIVHTKLNMSTGGYEYKINESPNTGNYYPFTGELRPYDEYGPETSPEGTWLMSVAAAATSYGPLYLPGHQAAETTMSESAYSNFARQPNFRFGFNPEAVWRESYEGDWLHVYKDLVWDITAAANVNDQEINDFLNLSYKNSFFWMHHDSALGSRFTPAFFKRTNTVGTGWEGNTPLTGTFWDILYMYSFTDSISNSEDYLWSNYFNGSVPNVPGDYSSWRSWNLAEQNYTVSSIGSFMTKEPSVYEYSYTLPNLSLAADVLETGDPIGNRLCYSKTWFNFVPLDSIRIISYEITTETIDDIDQQIVTLVTESRGYTFYAGDLIQVTEDAAIDGVYTIYQVNSNTQFKATLPGSTNTAGPVASTGIAAKLPPAT